MTLENKLDNIFTSYDESILSDGSIDPMIFRIIWTLRNKKFFYKINTISTDITYYTINLFHNYLLLVSTQKDTFLFYLKCKRKCINASLSGQLTMNPTR